MIATAFRASLDGLAGAVPVLTAPVLAGCHSRTQDAVRGQQAADRGFKGEHIRGIESRVDNLIAEGTDSSSSGLMRMVPKQPTDRFVYSVEVKLAMARPWMMPAGAPVAPW